MANYNTQITTNLPNNVAKWYDKKLIETMKPKLVHYEYAQKRPMPKNGGSQASFRKWTPFTAQTTPLVEGVVPDGQSLSMSEITATVSGYGGYVSISDMLDTTSIDPVADEAVTLMADQGALSVDTLIREAVHMGSNVSYSGAVSGRHVLTAANKLTIEDLRKAVRTLKKNKAPMFTRKGHSFYIAIVGPDTVYDLQSDSTWQAVSQYQDKENIYSGEIGRMFGVVVVETTESKIHTAEDLIAAGSTNESRSISAKSTGAYTDGTKTLLVNHVLSTEEAAALVGREIIINGFHDVIAGASAGAANSASLVLTTGYTGTASDLDGETVYPGEAGSAGCDIASTLVLGRDAYGVVDIEGSANARAIVKPAGSAGSSDPLNQISTVGWKVDAFVATILQQGWIVRVEHGFTA